MLKKKKKKRVRKGNKMKRDAECEECRSGKEKNKS